MTYALDDIADINEVLGRVSEFAGRVASRETDVLTAVRKTMEDRGMIMTFEPASETDKTVEAVDSAHAVFRTVSVQLIATAAVSYSKRTARKVVNAVPSLLSDDAEFIARGLSALYELALAYTSDAEVVLLDGSLMSFMLELVTFYLKLCNTEDPAVKAVREYVDPDYDGRYNVFSIAGSRDFIAGLLTRTDRRTVAIPKASASQDAVRYLADSVLGDGEWKIGTALLERYTDRSLFTQVLKSGEYFVYHTTFKRNSDKSTLSGLTPALDYLAGRGENGGLTVVVYRPYEWVPAYKVEIPGRVPEREVEEVVKTLSASIVNPYVKEHLEQYMADVFAKRFVRALVTASSVALQNAVVSSDDADSLLLLSYYRTGEAE